MAVVILGSYFLFSKVVLVESVVNGSSIISFIRLYSFGAIYACFLLFIFSHEKFFPVATEIENIKRKSEKKYLKKFVRFGKVIATFIVGVIGGPILSSFTARLLLNESPYKYFIVLLANVPATFMASTFGYELMKFIK